MDPLGPKTTTGKGNAMSYQAVNIFTDELSTEPTDGDIWAVSTLEHVRKGNHLVDTEFYVVTGLHVRNAGDAIYLTRIPSVDAVPEAGRGYERGKWVVPDIEAARRIYDGIYKGNPKGRNDKRHIVHIENDSAYCFVPSEAGQYSQLKPARPVEGNKSSLNARPFDEGAAFVSTFKPTPRAA